MSGKAKHQMNVTKSLFSTINIRCMTMNVQDYVAIKDNSKRNMNISTIIKEVY
jgi:hypothetical protein